MPGKHEQGVNNARSARGGAAAWSLCRGAAAWSLCRGVAAWSLCRGVAAGGQPAAPVKVSASASYRLPERLTHPDILAPSWHAPVRPFGEAAPQVAEVSAVTGGFDLTPGWASLRQSCSAARALVKASSWIRRSDVFSWMRRV